LARRPRVSVLKLDRLPWLGWGKRLEPVRIHGQTPGLMGI
jgi:hypothetical protein